MYSDRSRSRNSPSPPDSNHSYPPATSPPNFSDDNMSAPRGAFGQHSSSGRSSTHSSERDDASDMSKERSPYASHSTPSLPRYSSGQSVASSTNYLPHPSPLNPSAMRGGREGTNSSQASSRFSSHGYAGGHQSNNGAHPLSNAMYMDSSPTLAGSELMSPRDEKMRLGSGDQLGDYIEPRDRAFPASNGTTYRRGNQATGLTAFYRMLSGATLADSGKDARHVKLPRLGYLDGCKFIAAWVVLNGILFDAVLTTSDYSFIQRQSPLYITR
jgi:hypothetical protein